MALPVGVTTCTVTYGTALTYLGAVSSISATLTADRSVVWSATGQSLNSGDDLVQASSGLALSFAVPHVDQEGFVTAGGAAVDGWFYVLTGVVTFTTGKKMTFRKNFQVFVGDTSLDLDTVPDDATVLPANVVVGERVLSVAGETGVITAESLGEALGDTFVTTDDDGNLTIAGDVILELPVAAGSTDPLAPLWTALATNPSGIVWVRPGDSTTEGGTAHDIALKFLTTNGCPLGGMDPDKILNRGSTGFPLRDFLDHANGVDGAPVPSHPWSQIVADAPNVAEWSWGVNDARGGATAEELTDLFVEWLELCYADLPADCVLPCWVPAPFTSDVVGEDFFADGVTAESATAALRAAYAAIRNMPRVKVIDTAEVFGTAVLASSSNMVDQLHPQTWAHLRVGYLVGRECAPPGREQPAMGPARQCAKNGVVVFAGGSSGGGAGQIQIEALGWAGGVAPFELVQPAPTWQRDSTSDLYCHNGIVDLSTATFVQGGGGASHLLYITKTAFDWTTIAPEGTVVQLVGDYKDDGLRTGSADDYLDAPDLAPGATGVLVATTPGIKPGQVVRVTPPAAITAGYAVSAVAGNGKCVVTFTNTNSGGGNINYGTDLYNFRW